MTFNLEKEVYLVTQHEDLKSIPTELQICESLEAANVALSDISFGNTDDDNCRVYCGVIIPAKFIPDKLKGCTPYIIVFNPDNSGEVIFKKSPMSTDKLCSKIEELLSDELLFDKEFEFKDGTYTVGERKRSHSIEDVSIFFGSRLTSVLHVPEDALDEELIFRVTDLADYITHQKEKLNEGT